MTIRCCVQTNERLHDVAKVGTAGWGVGAGWGWRKKNGLMRQLAACLQTTTDVRTYLQGNAVVFMPNQKTRDQSVDTWLTQQNA